MNKIQQIAMGVLLACATASVLEPAIAEANATAEASARKKKWIRPLSQGKCDPKKFGTCRAMLTEATNAGADGTVDGEVVPNDIVFTELGL